MEILQTASQVVMALIALAELFLLLHERKNKN